MDPRLPAGFVALPPVALTFSLFQIIIYFTRDYFITYEEDISVSWRKVVEEYEIWRLMIAHYFHFSRSHLFWSVITLLTVGRYLEKKLTKKAMVLLIQLNGVVSNTIFICLNVYICPPETGIHLAELSYGFTSLTYGLRVALAYSQEPRNYEADILFGLYPVVLPAHWAPWQPLLEIIVLKICLPEACNAGPLSSTIAGFLLSFSALLFPHEWIFLPEANANATDHEEDSDDEDDIPLFPGPDISEEILRAIQINSLNIYRYTNQNGIMPYSFLERNIHFNRSLKFQLMLHQQLQQQAKQRGSCNQKKKQ